MHKVRFKTRHTFLDYIFGGCEINLAVAIDFTASNGELRHADSLHYLDNDKNEYLNVLRSIGSILEYYDTSKSIPCLGFGGEFDKKGDKTEHCFALNGNIF